MSFGAADLYLTVAIREELAELRAHPWRIEYLFNRYNEVAGVKKLVGDDFVRSCITMVMTQELTIQPYYTPNVELYPSLMIVAQYGEDQTYMGDYGAMQEGDDLPVDADLTVKPVVYANFDAKSASGVSVFVSEQLNIENSIWIGIGVTNKKFEAVVQQIIVIPGQDTEIVTNTPIPEDITLAGWTAGTMKRPKLVKINGSHDEVTIQMQLKTSGHPDVHRAWSQVVYHCMKRGRQRLDSYGIQNFQVSRSAPMLENQESMIMSTNFTGKGQELDTWISFEKNSSNKNGSHHLGG